MMAYWRHSIFLFYHLERSVTQFDNLNMAGLYTAFDHITVVGTTALIVPEPSTDALLAVSGVLGMVGAAAMRRRRVTAS